MTEIKNAINAEKAYSDKMQETNSLIEEIKREEEYIRYLNDTGWPLFLYNSDAVLKQHVLNAKGNNDLILEIASKRFDSVFWIQALSKWMQSKAIKEDRKPILAEAVQLHNEQRFYGSVSIMSCQFYGIGSDITDIMKKARLIPEVTLKQQIAKHYEVALKDIDNEKGKILQAISYTQRGVALWAAAGTYVKEIILSSTESKKRWAHHPIRNKICHGDQLNFCSEEHSIKALLTIDILIRMADELFRIAELTEKANI